MLDINSKISIYTYLLKIDKKIKICPLIWSLVKSASLYLLSLKFDILLKIRDTVGPRNNSLAFKGSPSIKVNILRSQMVAFNVISPLFKGYPEIKVKNLQSQWDR